MSFHSSYCSSFELRHRPTQRIMQQNVQPVFIQYSKIQTRQKSISATINARETFTNSMLQQLDAGETSEKKLVIQWNLTFFWTASSISRTNAVYYPCCCTIITKSNTKSWPPFPPNDSLEFFSAPYDYRNTLSIYLGILRRLVVVPNTMEDPGNISLIIQIDARPYRMPEV